MSKKEKLIAKIINDKSNISPQEACNILIDLGYKATSPSGGSSHVTFRKSDSISVTIVLTQNPLKPYMIAKLQMVLKKEGY